MVFRSSLCYSPNRQHTSQQNERNCQHADSRLDSESRNSNYSSGQPTEQNYSSPSADRSLLESSEQPRKGGVPVQFGPKHSPVPGPHSPKISSPQLSAQEVVAPALSPRREVLDNPIRGQVQAPVTSASTATDSLGVHGPRITSLPPGVTSGVAGPVVLNDGVPMIQKHGEVEGEVRASMNPPIKPSLGKGLLPYNITPPRPLVI
jgi:LIM domain-containing protein